ncbi:hypothetical protein D3C71_1311720 [compost metagenome]
MIWNPNTTIHAAAICPSSFTLADSSNLSSSAPSSTMRPPPLSSALMKFISRVENSYEINGDMARSPNTNARKIPRPPRRGIIFVCTLRAFGTSVAPMARASLLTSGVKHSASPMQTINPAMYIISIRLVNPHFSTALNYTLIQKQIPSPNSGDFC